MSIKYTERLADAEIDASVGTVGDSYDNALAETIIGLFKAEVVMNGQDALIAVGALPTLSICHREKFRAVAVAASEADAVAVGRRLPVLCSVVKWRHG